ncbi:hypothetical protein YC2023_001386 [Brassica napus]
MTTTTYKARSIISQARKSMIVAMHVKMFVFLQRVEDEVGEGCKIYVFLEVNKVA